jgi:hypothetical protein
MSLDYQDHVPLTQRISELLGAQTVAEPLGGMGVGAALRLRSEGRALVLKRARGPETYVYTRLSGLLQSHGVVLPELYGAFADADDWTWLLLEAVPQPLPRERWLADPAALALLGRLHAVPLAEAHLPPSRYRPSWPETLAEQALDLMPAAERPALAALLADVRARCLPLFAATCLLSGDPNPANWGLRADGTLVLFDWERCCHGTPALDLAITVPGLGTRADFHRVATVYSPGAGRAEVDRLAGEIGLAKVWSVVEFLAGVADGTIEPAFALNDLLDAIPAWMFQTSRKEE